jgi:minor extracellular serine protease Vpr
VGSLPSNQQLQITNRGASTVNLSLNLAPRTQDSKAHLTLSKSALTLGAGQSAPVTVSLGGTMPSPGAYEGSFNITGGAKPLHVPYLYVVGDGVANNINPIASGGGFDCTVGQDVDEGIVAFQITDQFGVPVANAPAKFSVNLGGGSIINPDPTTDVYGIATAEAVCGPNPGSQEFGGQAGGQNVLFDGTARLNPTISKNGAVGAADGKVGPVAPGSYLSLYGTGLSDTTDSATTATLPLAIDLVSVSFDVPNAGLSLPGRIYYVSPGLINLQVPWELQGQTSALIKVTIEDSQGSLYTLSLADYAPAFFVYPEKGTGRNLLSARDARSGKLISSANPAKAGEIVSLYANGLGPVNNQPATGEPAPLSPLSHTTLLPTVTINGQDAAVQFSGLTPSVTGLYVVNVTVPANVPQGVQQVVLTINGVSTPAAGLPVQ